MAADGHVEAIELDHHPGSVGQNAEAPGKFPFAAFEFSRPDAAVPYVKVVSPWRLGTVLSTFGTNASALLAGLPVGSFYRNGSDPDVVCVVH